MIAFAQYAETVGAFKRRMGRRKGIALLTARGASVAGGPISRQELLQQFIPGHREVPRAERIDLLLTTDLLSEGLNLQEASVVVHLDLPWNPARLDQRVGRVRRLGSRFDAITVYTCAPLASADRLLKLEQRLREKLCAAQETIGVAGRILPPLLGELPEQPMGAAEHQGAILSRLRQWRSIGASSDWPACAAAVATAPGFLACVIVDGAPHLIVERNGRLVTDVAVVHDAVEALGGPSFELDHSALTRARLRVEQWMAERRGSVTVDLKSAGTARARREALSRVSRALSRAPRHRRAIIAPLAEAARSAATATLGEGAERVLDMLVRSDLPDEAWLRSIVAFGELNVVPRNGSAGPDALVALVLFLNESS